MAKIYYNRLLLGTITYDAIPSIKQEEVLALGKADVRAGKLPIWQFEQMYKMDYTED